MASSECGEDTDDLEFDQFSDDGEDEPITLSVKRRSASLELGLSEDDFDESAFDLSDQEEKGLELIKACEDGDVDEVRKLIAESSGAEANFKDEMDMTPLIYAAQKGSVEICQLLLAHGANVNQKGDEGKTALFHACRRGRTKVVQLLLEQGALVNARDEEMKTPLFHASLMGREEIVNILLDHGAEINITDEDGRTALFYCFECDHIGLAKLLLQRGADTNMKAEYADNILLLRCMTGDNVNAIDSKGKTALIYACKKDCSETTKYLLREKGADPNLRAKGDTGMPPLMYACKRGNTDIASTLLSSGANPNTSNGQGRTALWYAITNGLAAIARMLIEKNAETNIKDSSGKTLLWAALDNDDIETAKLLISKGADVNETADYGEEALLFSCLQGKDANTTDEHGMTALLYATKKGKMRVAQYLISQKMANVNAADKLGWTPMHYLSLSYKPKEKQENSRRIETAKMLLSHGYNLNAKAEGTTAFYLSCILGDIEFVKLFLQHSADPNEIATGEDLAEYSQRSKEDIEEDDDEFDSSFEDSGFMQDRKDSSMFYEEETDALGDSGICSLSNLNYGPVLINVVKKQNENGPTIIKLLLEHGANVNIKDEREKRSPLLWSCLIRKEKGTKMAEVLLEGGADITDVDESKNTALILAIAVGNKKTVKLLLKSKEIDVNEKNKRGYTPLVTAVQDNYLVRAMADIRGNVEIAELLLKMGADVNLEGGGHKPLYFACSAGNLEMVKLLVKNGAEVNSKETYSTPLISAILKGNLEIVRYLVKKGADINSPVAGKTPLLFAKRRGLKKIKTLLVRSGAKEQEGEEEEEDEEEGTGGEEDDSESEEEWESEEVRKRQEQLREKSQLSAWKDRLQGLVLTTDDDDQW